MDDQNKNPVGRPRLFATPEEFEAKLAEYRAYLKENEEPITATGMALFMGFASKQSLYDYAEYPEFKEIVTKARTYIEYGYELKLHVPGPTAGPIFALKNMGWSDKQDLNISNPDGSMMPTHIILEAAGTNHGEDNNNSED